MKESARVLDIPRLSWSAGAPEPFLVSSEHRTLFAFYVPDHEAQDGEVRVAEFVGCTSVRFGFPSDEAFAGHPLYGRGLQFYAAHEVIDSGWLNELREIERKHPQAPAAPFATSRHYLLAFHDTTLEAVARDIEVHDDFQTIPAAVTWMADTALSQGTER